MNHMTGLNCLLENGKGRISADKSRDVGYSGKKCIKSTDKFDIKKATEVRRLLKEGAQQADLAKQFNCAKSTINHINRNDSWYDPKWEPVDGRNMRYKRCRGTGIYRVKTKVSPDDVREIRRLIKAGAKQGALAKKYGLSYQYISDIKRGRAWKDLK